MPGLTPDPRVDPVVTYAAGHVTGTSGTASYASYLSTGASKGQVLIGSGLSNPLGADVHLVVHDHDAIANLGKIGEEIHSFGSVTGADLAFAADES